MQLVGSFLGAARRHRVCAQMIGLKDPKKYPKPIDSLLCTPPPVMTRTHTKVGVSNGRRRRRRRRIPPGQKRVPREGRKGTFFEELFLGRRLGAKNNRRCFWPKCYRRCSSTFPPFPFFWRGDLKEKVALRKGENDGGLVDSVSFPLLFRRAAKRA